MTTPSAAVLFDPARSEKLTGLTAAALQALKTLNSGPATALAMSEPARGDDVLALMNHLAAEGWVTVTVRDSGSDLYSVLPFGQLGPTARCRHRCGPPPCRSLPCCTGRGGFRPRTPTGLVRRPYP